MGQFTKSSDGASIYYEQAGKGDTALLFVHGWGGNARWWDKQRDHFVDRYQVVQMDLAGHGKSSLRKGDWSLDAYAQDILVVVKALQAEKVVLIGHSMSGSNVVKAYQLFPEKVKKIVLVDTLQDLDHMPTTEEVAPFLAGMRQDFVGTIKMAFPLYSFAKTSPQPVVDRVVQELCKMSPELAISCLEPFYATDIRKSCLEVKVPVRGVFSDLYPISKENNRKYFKDFDCEVVKGVGHYLMMEAPEQFNDALTKVL